MLRRFVVPWLCAGVAARMALTGYESYARRFIGEKQPKASSPKAKDAAKRPIKLPTAVEVVADAQMKAASKRNLQLPQPRLQGVAPASAQLKQKRLARKLDETGLPAASPRAPKQELEMMLPVSKTTQQGLGSTLVYNALTGRMTSEVSPSMLCLKSIGFGVNEKRQVYLEKPEVVRQLSQKMRNGTATLPAHWPVSIIRALGVILRNRAILDPAEAIQQMIQVKINNLAHNRYAAIINAVGSGDIDDALDQPSDDLQAVELNEEQKQVIELALKGHLLYIGGSAGTGKTVLLRALNHRLQAERLRVAMTATTGVAGCHIGGSTFHHALGVNAQGEFLRKSHLLDYDVIIVDEVSMLSKRMFEEFDRTLREEAGTPDLPFGGVQIILCGDFLQLGVINESSIISSSLFQESFVKLRLETQVRQVPDSAFANSLQQLRLGVVPDSLLQSVQQLPAGTMVESAVNLLPTNKEVHAANERELQRLPGDAVMLVPETGITSLKWDATATLLLRTKSDFKEEEFSKHVRSLLQATLDMPKASLLCLYRVYEDGHAMRVCLPQGESATWRDAMRERFLEVAGLINDLELGATVTEILPNGDGMHTPEIEEYLQKLMQKHPIAQPVTFKKGCRVLLRANLTSRLVNGSIGTVVDFVECALQNIPSFLRSDRVDNCVERYRIFCMTECGMQVPLLPVVRFHSGETVVVPPWEFNVGGGPITNYYSLSSVALPLCLAYAFTVHKVQGLTLVGRVHLELSRMWPCEHLLYVAMSRVRNPEQLSMSSFQHSMVVANKECVEFDRKLPVVGALPSTANFHVSSWKRCSDTVYHLRRRGASLSHLLTGAALNEGHSTDAGGARLVNPVKGTLEHSVLVARRLRKLVKCTERAAKLQANRRKPQPAPAANSTDDADDTTAVEHIL
ncbi:putative DNA repair and recombination protein,mitochondrial precursor [Trypanosoma conorhini]|uniref:ATP-dependent DNA helicase n=1 Tax=Trypanosoma conorhini TaxID=83891 RepID=A0A422Q7B2_9TRYP|nr:putative DNA repair and recombination protein,mitochondrial precursor [Trypanosoma conorhini]RNF25850.1 putative DNA repair and recombination protein,mitochondrial precursor [Trypanosoma conorhini]